MTLFERDFDSLAVGDRFTTASRTVGEDDIAAFATLTGDTHPQHVDEAWAAGSRFGERIAHGLLVLSFASGPDAVRPGADRGAAPRGDAVFKAPVKIGDSVHVEGELTGLREIDDANGLVDCRWRVLNQDGKLVVRASVELVWRRVRVPEPALI